MPDTVLTLLAARKDGATICPSEVARALATAAGTPTEWRGEMAAVHAAVGQMAEAGLVRLTWRGEARTVADGPYRIGSPSW